MYCQQVSLQHQEFQVAELLCNGIISCFPGTISFEQVSWRKARSSPKSCINSRYVSCFTTVCKAVFESIFEMQRVCPWCPFVNFRYFLIVSNKVTYVTLAIKLRRFKVFGPVRICRVGLTLCNSNILTNRSSFYTTFGPSHFHVTA